MSEMTDKLEALERRVQRLEAALLALSTGQPIGFTSDGFVVAPAAHSVFQGRASQLTDMGGIYPIK